MNFSSSPCRLTLSAGLAASIVSLALLFSSASATAGAGLHVTIAGQSGSAELRPGHPQRYIVKRGDTLWDISAMFLRDPWFWPEIWYVNPQVRNPHLIYPGDVLTLVYVDGQPQLRLERGGVERLSPRIREEGLEAAITTIPRDVIAAFLNRGAVLSRDEIDSLPYVIAIREGHLIGAAGNDVYVRGNVVENSGYSVVHIGDEIVDPDTDEVLGFAGIYVGEGTVRRGGDPATLTLKTTNREALEGDRLIDRDERIPLQFYPRPPEQQIDGRIIHVVDGVSQLGQYQVAILNRGVNHGLEPGNVLTIWQAGETVDDRFGNRVINEKVTLPEERAGTLMVFKAEDRLSFALVMEATSEIHLLDKVRSPD